MTDFDRRPLGSLPTSEGVQFRVWAPKADSVELLPVDSGELHAMTNVGNGYFEHRSDALAPGSTYYYRLDGGDPMPDPASRFQPEGVHGPSMVIDPFPFERHELDWEGLTQHQLSFYELHVGTFSPEGTFDGVRERIPYLKNLGITAIELMPVADFPGRWNWGYDPAAFYAPSRAYGHPDDLRRLVDAAHREGLAVFLDVIYNHLGPDGAYAAAYAPFFTEKHETPWGQAVNLDDEGSEGIRHFFIDNALHWLQEYRFDGLRLDATFALKDDSPTHFLQELADAVRGLSEGEDEFRRYLIAEDHRNERQLIEPRSEGGYGLDGTWVDDFHHQIRNHLAGDTAGYFEDFADTSTEDIATTLQQGWFFSGQYAEHFGHERGTDPSGLRPDQFVFYIQNHDQVGNRPMGDRLTESISLPQYRAATALLLFCRQLPLLFMGQEWAATSPFQYFTDHNEELGRLVSQGRREEFGHFPGFAGEVPDPQDPSTFERSKLDWEEAEEEPHAGMLRLYRALLRHRRQLPRDSHSVKDFGESGLHLQRGDHHLLVALAPDVSLPVPTGADVLLQTEAPEFTRDGSPAVLSDELAQFPTAGAVLIQA